MLTQASNLVETLVDGSDSQRSVVQQSIATLSSDERRELRDALITEIPRLRQQPRWGPRSWLSYTLGRIGADDPSAEKVLSEQLDPDAEPIEQVRYWTLAGLHRGDPQGVDKWVSRVSQDSSPLVAALIDVIAASSDPAVQLDLKAELESGEPERQESLARALREIPLSDLEDVLISLAESKTTPAVKRQVDKALASYAQRDPSPASAETPRDSGAAPTKSARVLDLGSSFSDTVKRGLTYAAQVAILLSQDKEPARPQIDSQLILAGLLLHGAEVDRIDTAALIWQWISAETDEDPLKFLGLRERLGSTYDLSPEGALPRWSDFNGDGQRLLEAALAFAVEADSPNSAAGRHVLGVLIAPRGVEFAGQSALGGRGVDMSDLRREVLGFLRDKAWLGDAEEPWIELLQPTEPHGVQAWLAGYSTDLVGDEVVDELDIATEVNALCAIIAAHDVHPPLSVGLFGDWGSGKTFFMNMMKQRIEWLTRNAATTPGSAFHSNIAQVKFNAWHYVDANLWASLVTHLFNELARYFDGHQQPGQWDEILKQAESVGARLKEAEDELHKAEEEETAARERAEAIENELQATKEDIEKRKQQLSLSDLRDEIFAEPSIQTELEEVSENLGLPHARERIESGLDGAEAIVRQSRTLVGRIRALWAQFPGSGPRKTLFLLGLVAVIAAPAAVAWLASSSLGLQQSTGAVIAGLAGSVGMFFDHILAIRPRLDQVDGAVGKLENTLRNVRLRATADLAARQVQLDAELVAAQAAAGEARVQAAAAASRVEEINREQEKIRDGTALAEMIRDRAASPGYRDELGIINDIRGDFEGLSRYLTDHLGQDLPPLDRIVLYIDDLDRCPTERVKDVLQAVHLLMAFPLFVVVVGVDSRWLLHSLEQQYSAFGGLGGPGDGLVEEEEGSWLTTPQHYLEKIFQIPFSLRRMDPDGYGKLVESLTGTASLRSTGSRVEPDSERDPHPPDEEGLGDVDLALPPEPVQPAASATTDTKETPLDDDTSRAKSHVDEADLPAMPAGDFVANPPGLELGIDEVAFMKQLDRLVPSPRAAKRFVNSYRLVKSTASHANVRDLEAGEHQAALLMLAFQTGFPVQAYDIFRALTREPATGWSDFVERLEPTEIEGSEPPAWENAVNARISPAELQPWRILASGLRDVDIDNDEIAPFVKWCPRVARFGFLSGRVVA